MTRVVVDLPDGPLDLDDAPWTDLAALPAPNEPVRLAYAAAHVVLAPSYADVDHAVDRPGGPADIAAHIDWDATMRFRAHLDAHGFGVAEAMDTAQRFALGWTAASELIRRCGALAPSHGFIAGASTDHVGSIDSRTQLVDAVVEQIAFIQSAGGVAMILPMQWLSRHDATADEYVATYIDIIDAAAGPLYVHWLGAMFLPALEGYFPGDSFDRIMDHDPATVRGVKMSLLDAAREVTVRTRLRSRDQIVLTGDDFHFADLVAGDGAPPTETTRIGTRPVPIGPFSHALLGIFDGIAAPAGLALRRLGAGDRAGYDRIMRPCETLSRLIFSDPTRHYKTGLAFLAWLNGHQQNRMLVNHEEHCRDRVHLLGIARLANAAGAITDAACAAERLSALIAGTNGH